MAKKSVVMVVSFYPVDQDEIDKKIDRIQGDAREFLEMTLLEHEGIKVRDTHAIHPNLRTDRRRFEEILINYACAAVMGEPDYIYIVKK